MVKKRFKLAIFLVLTLLAILLTSASAMAGCCVGVTGCSRAYLGTECAAGISTYQDIECEDIQQCDIVACCHQIAGIPLATFRSTCEAMQPPVQNIQFIQVFDPDPTIALTIAQSKCSGAQPGCDYLNCEQANQPGCQCGSATTTEGNTFCCGADDAIFPSLSTCSSSLSCQSSVFYDIEGRVTTPQGDPIPGANVRAGGKQSTTDELGNFLIELLPDQSSGIILVVKNNSVNSTPYTIQGADVTGVEITLVVGELPSLGAEICDNGFDDDGDQFGWNTSPLMAGHIMAADWCDSDCESKTPGRRVKSSVSQAYYTFEAEWKAQDQDFCSDNIDNDCDGYTDCEDEECRDNSPSCKATFCGDGIVQFPNAVGEFEQCDINVSSGTGQDGLCPGKCILAGQPNQCHCLYEAVCGNSVVDEPIEDCDGVFIASENRWKVGSLVTGPQTCTENQCGLPNSPFPCQCPPPQVCGNGQVEDPEQCDLGQLVGGDPRVECPDGGACSPNCQCPPSPVVCGNNLLELGEDCDGTWDELNEEWIDFRARKYGCTRDNCAPPVQEWLSKPQLPARTETDYTDMLSQPPFTGAEGQCRCPTQCAQSPPGPELLGADHKQYEQEIDVSWDDVCGEGENAQEYNVFRCEATDIEGSGCELDTQFSAVNTEPIPVGIWEYPDTTFQASTADNPRYYCYKIEGVYETVTPPGSTPVKSEDMICIEAGREECFVFRDFYPTGEEFCSANVRSQCNETNQINPVEDSTMVDCNDPDAQNPDYVCVGPYASGQFEDRTRCVPRSLCDYCQDPFGLFAYSNSPGEFAGDMELELGNIDDYGLAPEQASEQYSRQFWVPCVDLDFCYMDYSHTTTDMFYALKQNMTCYDYKSEEACLVDKGQVGNCEWASHPLYGELGIGVCRTTLVDQQDCSKCHDPLNKIFGKCDRDMCALYGRCYYDKNNRPEDEGFRDEAFISFDHPVKTAEFGWEDDDNTYYFKCRHEREINCENYDKFEDCVNSDSPYSKGGTEQLNVDFDLNVSGITDEQNRFWKQSGNNMMIEGSDDFFNFSKCMWVQDMEYEISVNQSNLSQVTETYEPYPNFGSASCMKNSDDSLPTPEYSSGTYFNRTVTRYKEDCENKELVLVNGDEKLCLQDFTEPATSLPIYNGSRISGNFTIEATVADDSLQYTLYDMYYPSTYACISEPDMTCYPNGTADHYGRDAGGNFISFNNVNYNVTYNQSNVSNDTIYGIVSGWYKFRYFSEDISHNLEPITDYDVYIDADPPNVIITLSNTSWEEREDEWRTNLTLKLDIIPRDGPDGEDDKYATCKAKMYLGNTTIFPLQDIGTEEYGEYNNSWERTYDFLLDDYYVFSYECVDQVGNIAAEEYEIIVDNDRSLTDPKPRGTLNTNDITLEISTGTNAECRYKHELAELPQFWSNNTDTFSEAEFNSMTKFDFTGSVEKPSVIHRTIAQQTHGYHRYYVKCKMFADGKIKGNNADQIRFAIDYNDPKAPPVTDHTVNAQAYNGWYNQDLRVELVCDDPVIQGQGNEWQYGCLDTYYCKGIDCDQYDEYQRFQDHIALTQTTYITYYSEDKGHNKETPKQNVLFQIDKEPGEVNLTILRDRTEAGVIVLDKTYRVRLTSKKPIISPLVESPIVSFTSNPSKFTGDVEMLPTNDSRIWEGLFRLDDINANRDFEGTLVFESTGHDHHNVGFFTDKVIPIDTKPPNMPIVEPSLELPTPELSDYQTMGYPVKYFDGVYYTGAPRLKITGYTDENLVMIGVRTSDDLTVEVPFTQGNATYTSQENATPGCCVGSAGCFRGGSSEACPLLTQYVPDQACEDITTCDIVACCHNQTGLPKATYRGRCEAVQPTPSMTLISQFTSTPTLKEAQANVLCGNAFACAYSSCEQANPFACSCGSSTASISNPYCCGLDDAVFSTQESCQASAQCVVTETEEPEEAGGTFSFQDQVISGFEGNPEIRIAGDIRNKVSVDDFVGFGSEQTTIGPRTAFGYYGLFYDITSIQYHGGDDKYTSFNVYPPLEKALSPNEAIYFYDKERPTFWFGINVLLKPLTNTTFYLKSYDNAGNLVRYPPITQDPPVLTFFYDPNPPRVISHKPIDGSTARNTFDISLYVSEGKLESGLDFNTTQFMINGDLVDFEIELMNQSSIDPTNNYYRIYHHASNLEDGQYDIEVKAPDRATNELATDQANSSWTIVVDQTLPWDPEVTFLGCNQGVGEDIRYYCRSSPDFIIDFSYEPNQVNITDIRMASTYTTGEAAVCNETSFNVFRCRFTEPKTTQPGFFWSDYGVIIDAFKTLDDGTTSNTGNYGPFPFTVDDTAPKYGLDFNARIRDNFNLSVLAIVTNENHALKASIDILGQTYEPIYSSFSGTRYNFIWPVPDFKKTQEGETTMVMTICDFADNCKDTTIPVYIDLTPPEIESLNINISDTIQIAGEYVTKEANVTITGKFRPEDTDVTSIWLMPGGWNSTSGEYADKTLGTVSYDDEGQGNFIINLEMPGPPEDMEPFMFKEMLISEINNRTLFVQDLAGHVSQRTISVIRDIAPPLTPTFTIQ